MAIEVECCQAVCSSIAEDLLLLDQAEATEDTLSQQTVLSDADSDSSEPLSDEVAILALVSPPTQDTKSQCEDESVVDGAERCYSHESSEESFTDVRVESPSGSERAAVDCETPTTPSLMCNNSAGPAIVAASPSAVAACVGFLLNDNSENCTTTTTALPWSLLLKLDVVEEEPPCLSLPATVSQDNTDSERELCEQDQSEAAYGTAYCTKRSSIEEVSGESSAEEQSRVQATAETDVDSEMLSNLGSDDMDISLSDSFIERLNSECGDITSTIEETFAELELLHKEQMEDSAASDMDLSMSDSYAIDISLNTSTEMSIPDSCALDMSVDTSTEMSISDSCALDMSVITSTEEEVADSCVADDNLDGSDNCSSARHEDANIISAAIVAQSDTDYLSNSSCDEDDEEEGEQDEEKDDEEEEEEEEESSDCENLLGRDSPSPPSVDDSSLFPSVEEVETRTGISFESSGPSCSAPSYSTLGRSSSSPTERRNYVIRLTNSKLRMMTDVERNLRRYVLLKMNMNRLYQEAREERLCSHRRQKNSSTAETDVQNSSDNLPSSSFLNNSTPSGPRSSSPIPFGGHYQQDPSLFKRPDTPFGGMGGGGGGSMGSSNNRFTFSQQSISDYNSQAELSSPGQHGECQEGSPEPPAKRARLSLSAEENKENNLSSPPPANVFGSGGQSYPASNGAEFYTPAPSTPPCTGLREASTPISYSEAANPCIGDSYYHSQTFAYAAYYSNFHGNSFPPDLSAYLESRSHDSDGSTSHTSNNSSNNVNYSMATGAVEADAYNNVSSSNGNNVNSLDRGLTGFNNNLGSSSDIILEHIDEEIRRRHLISNNRSSSCPPFSSSSSSLFSSSQHSSESSSPFSQSLSSSQAPSSSTPSLYNNHNSSQYNHYSSGPSWNNQYSPLYSYNGAGSSHSSSAQQQSLQPYQCGRSSLMLGGGNDFQSVVLNSLMASLET